MQIEKIVLRDFRNYTHLELSPQKKVNLLIGKNAQGKTNLLESIYLCCLGKSHRTPRDIEMVRYNAEKAYVYLEVRRKDGPRTVEVLLDHRNRKRIRILGSPIRKMAELMGHINCVLFSPEDLQLVKGGPRLRRRFLDTTLCQLDLSYFTALAQYNITLAQRNALLKTMKQRDIQEDLTMDVFEEKLAQAASKIICARRNFIERLCPLARRIHQRIAPQEEISLEYQCSAKAVGQSEIALELRQAYHTQRREDIRRLLTSIGPHREDIEIYIDQKPARTYASQGQQRTAALSLKLGGLDLMEQQSGERPVLLLDDVLSELDDARQQALLSLIEGQAFITCATAPKTPIPAAEVFYVSNHTLTKKMPEK